LIAAEAQKTIEDRNPRYPFSSAFLMPPYAVFCCPALVANDPTGHRQALHLQSGFRPLQNPKGHLTIYINSEDIESPSRPETELKDHRRRTKDLTPLRRFQDNEEGRLRGVGA